MPEQPRRSLENHLFSSMLIFYLVSLGTAKGLAFLHETKVMYRDFKTSNNVPLDSRYNAILSDFSLARDLPTGDKSHESTCFMCMYGYAAPEYLATGLRWHTTESPILFSSQSDIEDDGASELCVCIRVFADKVGTLARQHAELLDRHSMYEAAKKQLTKEFKEEGTG